MDFRIFTKTRLIQQMKILPLEGLSGMKLVLKLWESLPFFEPEFHGIRDSGSVFFSNMD